MKSWPTQIPGQVLLLALSFLAATTQAVAQATTGGITGQVVDSAGVPVSDATVEVLNTETGLRRTVSVSQSGNYTVLGLAPGGPYRVTVRAIGHRPVVREGVRVPLSQSVRADATMARQAVEVEELVVLADAPGADFAPSRQGTQTTINDTLLRRLPTLDRDFTDFVKLTPQVQVREGEGGITAAGQNNRFNTVQVDGATVNDRFGLGRTGQAGGQADGRSVGLEAVKEYQVLLSPYDVRQGNFSGALINAVTKSGTNRFSGSVFAYHRNENLTGYPLDGTDFSNWQFGASLGGPIQQDRVHFFANYERRSEDKPAAGPFFGGPGPIVVRPEDVAAYNAAAAGYGLSTGTFDRVDITRPADNLLGRLDVLIGDNSRLVAKFQYNDAALDVFDRSSSVANPFIELSNNGYFFNNKTYNPSVQFFTNFANGAANELLLSANIIRDRRTPFVREPVILVQNLPQVTAGQIYTIQAGGEEFSHANELDQNMYEITNNFSIPVGAHRVTLGARWEGYKVRNLFGQNIFGRWQFDSLSLFQAGTVEQYQIRFGLPGSNNGESRFRAGQFAVYAQDDWAVSPTFTLNPGLRIDLPYFTTGLSYDPRVIEDFGPQDKPGGQVMISPRLGFNWDVRGAAQSQLRGGAGVFTGAPAFVWYSNAYANNGLGLVALTCGQGGIGAAPAFNPDPDNPPISCAGGETVGPGGSLGEVDLIADYTRFPQVFRANLAYDRRLPYGLVASVEGLYSKDINQFFIVNRNLLAPARTDATGRVIYPGTLNANGTLSPQYFDLALYGPSFAGGVYELRNTDEGYSFSLTGQLRKEFGRNVQASIGYTYSEAYDVQSFTSSRAISNWRFSRMLAGADLADNRTRSSFDRPHRIVGNFTYTVPWRFPTDLSFTYIGQSGTPYTLRSGGASGRGDLNLDGTNTNDPIYIPTGPGDPNSPYAFQTPANEAAFDQYIAGESCLEAQRGRIMERNSCRNPWQNQLDVALRQRLPVFRGDAAFEVQIFNFLRMLDRDWGQAKTVGGVEFFDQEALTAVSSTGGADPKHVVTFNELQLRDRFLPVTSNASINRSTYYIQAGLRYSF
ncbi:MAG TPA: carboxypeptidase regulatory-like domain-containing protein [Gemmatimonadales bacterium]